MADQTEQNYGREPRPDILQGPRINYDIPGIVDITRLSTPQASFTKALGVLLLYAAFLRYSIQVPGPTVPKPSFKLSPKLPPINHVNQDQDVNSEFSAISVLEFYVAFQVLVLLFWPIWQAFTKGTTFVGFVFRCLWHWSLSLLIYLGFLKLTQYFGLA